jgi:hypothetical protein
MRNRIKRIKRPIQNGKVQEEMELNVASTNKGLIATKTEESAVEKDR